MTTPDDEPEPHVQPPKPKPWHLHSIDELENIPPPTWLIDHTLCDGLTVLYGPAGAKKSFLALDWSASIAAGHKWFNRPTIQKPVVYVSGEGGGGLSQRINAWRRDRQTRPDPLYTIPHAVKLMEPWQIDYLEEDVHHVQAGLLVIDTLARSMAGGDENSAADMGLAVSRLDQIRTEHNCAVLIVHHSGKDPLQERGSSALRAAADAVIKADSPYGQPDVDITCEKQKDAPEFWPWTLQLKTIGESAVLTTRASGQRQPNHTTAF